jgi:hypothetical protein
MCLTDNFALANIFQVLESNMGIIGACLPVLRMPLRRFCPCLFRRSRESPKEYYESDPFTDRYVIRQGPGQVEDGGVQMVTITGPTDVFRSGRPKGDEMGKPNETVRIDDKEDVGGLVDNASPMSQGGIRKHVDVSIDRKSAGRQDKDHYMTV